MPEVMGNLFGIVGLLVLAVFVAGALAPFEALGWWAGWFGEDLVPERPAAPRVAASEDYVVYLSGINSVSGEAYAAREVVFLARLEAELSSVTFVGDIFPYSVINRALTSQRLLSRLWRWIYRRKLQGPTVAGFLINLRNFWQVGVSADRRYGPIYNQGSATLILGGLGRHGYLPGKARTLTLIGYSGGSQIAVGAAPYLQRATGARVRVISLGGVISADPGILALDKLYHLYGARDAVERLATLFFPGRWPLLPHSAWNRGRREGKVALLPMGPVKHTGPGGYLDAQSGSGGEANLDRTLRTVVSLIRGDGEGPGLG
jgi:hypothetical protein